jgi:hypothetical protein
MLEFEYDVKIKTPVLEAKARAMKKYSLRKDYQAIQSIAIIEKGADE